MIYDVDFVLARYGLPGAAPKLKLSKVPTGSVKYCRQPGGAEEEDFVDKKGEQWRESKGV